MEKSLVRQHWFVRTALIAALLVLCLSIAVVSAIAAEPPETDAYENLPGAGDHMEFEAEDGYEAIAAISAEIDEEDDEEDTAGEENGANANLNPATGR